MEGNVMGFKMDQAQVPGLFRPGFWRRLLVFVLLAGGILIGTGCVPTQGSIFGGNNTDQAEPYQLSGEQSALISENGYPEAFILLFYEEEAADGSLQTVRQETWEYYSLNESYTFLNGEVESIEDLKIDELGTLALLPYTPEQFSAHMGRDEVLAAAGVDDFIEVPLDKEYLEDGNLYYTESLAFGLVDGELRYLEALALIEE